MESVIECLPGKTLKSPTQGKRERVAMNLRLPWATQRDLQKKEKETEKRKNKRKKVNKTY